MRTITLAILGAPFACWALYACLAMLGVSSAPAVVAAIGWGVLWLVIVHFGANSRLIRARRSMRGRGLPGGRGVWTGAVIGSFFLPIPVALLTLMFAYFGFASSEVVLPILTMLALPAPTALWWMILWPVSDREEEMLRPIGWRRFTPHAPVGTIPPRPKRTDLR